MTLNIHVRTRGGCEHELRAKSTLRDILLGVGPLALTPTPLEENLLRKKWRQHDSVSDWSPPPSVQRPKRVLQTPCLFSLAVLR